MQRKSDGHGVIDMFNYMFNLVWQAREHVAVCDVESPNKSRHPGRTTSRFLVDENSAK